MLATLRYLYPSKFDEMITREALDLQDCKSGIGIEVTIAVKESDMKASRAFSEICQDKSKYVENRKRIIKSSGYSIVPYKDEKVAVVTSGTSDGEKHIFQESLRRKIKKLQQYRTKFDRIGLAILLPEIPTNYSENHFSECISELTSKSILFYDFVYVIAHRFCLYYDIQEPVTDNVDK